jgi:hypothetical protein
MFSKSGKYLVNIESMKGQFLIQKCRLVQIVLSPTSNLFSNWFKILGFGAIGLRGSQTSAITIQWVCIGERHIKLWLPRRNRAAIRGTLLAMTSKNKN